MVSETYEKLQRHRIARARAELHLQDLTAAVRSIALVFADAERCNDWRLAQAAEGMAAKLDSDEGMFIMGCAPDLLDLEVSELLSLILAAEH
jgi:hypothetical protein